MKVSSYLRQRAGDLEALIASMVGRRSEEDDFIIGQVTVDLGYVKVTKIEHFGQPAVFTVTETNGHQPIIEKSFYMAAEYILRRHWVGGKRYV